MISPLDWRAMIAPMLGSEGKKDANDTVLLLAPRVAVLFCSLHVGVYALRRSMDSSIRVRKPFPEFTIPHC
jgi:hypothetical protein